MAPFGISTWMPLSHRLRLMKKSCAMSIGRLPLNVPPLGNAGPAAIAPGTRCCTLVASRVALLLNTPHSERWVSVPPLM